MDQNEKNHGFDIGDKRHTAKKIDRASLWQQLSQIIVFEMIQIGQIAIFKIAQAESINNEV